MKLHLLIGIFVLAVIAGFIIMVVPGPKRAGVGQTPATSTPQALVYKDLIKVTSPLSNAVVGTTITITGEARGPWYFEASFPIEIHNASGTILGAGPAQAQGEWMTTDYVPFTATLSVPPQPAGSHGTIVLKKDNPSGLPEHDDSVSIPIVF